MASQSKNKLYVGNIPKALSKAQIEEALKELKGEQQSRMPCWQWTERETASRPARHLRGVSISGATARPVVWRTHRGC
jgi:hypothetical protein